ncbi:MAG: STAS domain-containing protein [Pseudomonadota bacterium]
MLMDSREENGKLVLCLEQERLDSAIAVDFKNALFSHIDNGQTRIVFDMSNIKFVDSSGLGALVSALKKIGGTGELCVSCVNPAVMTVFEMTRLNKVFKIHEDTDTAVAA